MGKGLALVSIPDRVLGIFRRKWALCRSEGFFVSIPDRVLGIFRRDPKYREPKLYISFNP